MILARHNSVFGKSSTQRVRPFALALLVGLLVCLGDRVSPSRAEDEEPDTKSGKKYALVVGVRTYLPNEPLPKLGHTENDALGLAEVLEKGGYDVTLMTQSAAAKEGNEVFAPTADYIREQLDAILANKFLKKEDVVIVALAGHGIKLNVAEKAASDTPSENKKPPRFYFCPADAKIKGLQTATDVKREHNLIDIDELYDGLKKCKAGGKLLMVDACRNDPTVSGGVRTASVTLPELPPPPGGTLAFFSCSANEQAVEDRELKHGVFFHFVIDALKGEADTSTASKPADKVITLTELNEYVGGKVYDFVRKKYKGMKQTPELRGEIRGALPLISVTTALASTKPVERPMPTPMPTEPRKPEPTQTKPTPAQPVPQTPTPTQTPTRTPTPTTPVPIPRPNAGVAESPLEVFDDQTFAVVRIASPQGLLQQCRLLIDRVVPGMGFTVLSAKEPGVDFVENWGKNGADAQREWWVGLSGLGDPQARVVVAVRVNNIDQLRTFLTATHTVTEYKGWAIVTKDAAATRSVTERMTGKGQSIAGLIDVDSKSMLERGDVGVAFHMPLVAGLMKTGYDGFDASMKKQLSEAKTATDRLGIEVGRDLLGGLFRATIDAKSAALALTVNREEVRLDFLGQVQAGSKTDDVLRAAPTSEMATLNHLPTGFQIYTGSALDMLALAKWGAALQAASGDSAQAKSATEYFQQIAGLRFGPAVVAIRAGNPGEPWIQTTSITEVNDTLKYYNAWRSWVGTSVTGFTGRIEPVQERVDAYTVDTVSLVPAKGADAGLSNVWTQIFGSAGLQYRSILFQDRLYQVIGPRTLLTELINAQQGTGHAALRQARAKLSPTAQLYVLADLGSLLHRGLKIGSGMGLVPASTVEAIPQRESYLAISAQAQAGTARLTLHVPTAQIDSVADVTKAIIALAATQSTTAPPAPPVPPATQQPKP